MKRLLFGRSDRSNPLDAMPSMLPEGEGFGQSFIKAIVWAIGASVVGPIIGIGLGPSVGLATVVFLARLNVVGHIGRRPFNWFPNLILALVVVALLAAGTMGSRRTVELPEIKTSELPTPTVFGATAAEQASPSSNVNGTWSYSEGRDELTGKPVQQANLSSANSLEFKFPYQGAQHARLSIRSHPRWGLSVILAIERGQFHCGDIDCSVNFSFDNDTIIEYQISPPESNDANIRFISKAEDFLTRLRISKSISIEASFFHEGNRVMHFYTNGLRSG